MSRKVCQRYFQPPCGHGADSRTLVDQKLAGRLQCSQSEKKTSWSKKVANYVADVHLDAREALLHTAESHEEVVSAC